MPGVSSALAAPLLAGIPLTATGVSSGFTVVSAHNPSGLDWLTLAKLETLVMLMGGKHLPEIVAHLQHHGHNPQRPVAIIRSGGWENQQVWVGTLATIVAQTQGVSLSPAVIVVGNVVTLRSAFAASLPTSLGALTAPSRRLASVPTMTSVAATPLNSADPLQGKTIVVTRSASQSQTFSDRLRSAGAMVLEVPALEIGPPSSWAPLDQAIATLDQFNWLILTSANGVTGFMDRLHHQGRDARSLGGLKIAVVGRKTASCLRQRGLEPDFIPPNYVADALADQFPDKTQLAGAQLLFPRVETGGRDVLVAQLTVQGANVVEVPAYESRCPAAMDPNIVSALNRHEVDGITFASSKTVRNFSQLLRQAGSPPTQGGSPPDWQQCLTATCLASIGPQTSQACIQYLGRVDLEAKEYTLEGLAEALIDHFKP